MPYIPTPPKGNGYLKTGKVAKPTQGVSQKFGNGGGAFSGPAPRGAQAKAVAKKAITAPTNVKASRPKSTPKSTPSVSANVGPTSAPPTPDMAPEDAALQGLYPTDLNINQNQKLKGLAGTVQLPNALNYANASANMQYGPAIQQTAGRIKGLIAALPGAMDSLNKAFANVDAQAAARGVLQSTQTSGQGVANLFSGQGGTGAAGAAALAANQAVQSNATTANQQGTLNDQAAAGDRRQADWATRIQLLNNMAVNQGRSDLAGLTGQRDSAKKAYYDQGLKMRGDMISQSIGNQGALQNQKIAAALASGQIEGMKLTNEQKTLLVQQMGISNAYLPDQLKTGIQGQRQGIVNSIVNNKLSEKALAANLAKAGTDGKGVTKLSDALKSAGPDAVTGMIIPAGAMAQNATTGRPVVYGDLNTYFNKGVDRIMKTLPQSDRKNVKQYVANILQTVASETNQWVYKGGRFVKVKGGK